MKTDAQIEKDVERELAWDTRTWKLGIDVEVRDGIVDLNGMVRSFADKLAAQDAALRVTGVLDVVNGVTVQIDRQITDEEIAHAVRQVLRWNAKVPHEMIKSSVTYGWVTLTGVVSTLSQSENAEHLVEQLTGVKGVRNEIVVQLVEQSSDELKEVIRKALERRADREALRLRINVVDGEIDITGRVHSWQERKAVLGSITPLAGVRKINDRLRIDPYF